MHQTRERIIAATNELFRTKGYNGTSLSDVTRAAGAPTGSIYHFFPGGKRDLAAAVIVESAASYRQLFELIVDDTADAPTAIQAFFDGAAAVLAETDYIDLCPIGTVAREVASTDDDLRRATAAAFAGWTDAVVRRFRADAMNPAAARPLATTVIALLEGSLVLARASRDATVVQTAGVHARTLIEVELARPARRSRSDPDRAGRTVSGPSR